MTSSAHAPGDIVAGRFELDRLIGEGAMGAVWAATHAVTHKRVALKFLKPRATGNKARFLREARAASAIDHESVVDVHDIFELDDGTPVMVLELLDGESLQDHLDRRGALTPSQAAVLLVPVIEAMEAAHALGIVHRDLKPDNVFLARDSAGVVTVKVLDFGIAKVTMSDALADVPGATRTGALIGTPCYMSPEQACGLPVDPRSDIWSLGVIAYQTLTGQVPTAGENVGAVLKRVMTADVTPLREAAPALPADVVDLVDRMMAELAPDRPTLEEARLVLLAHAGGAPAFAPVGKTVPLAIVDAPVAPSGAAAAGAAAPITTGRAADASSASHQALVMATTAHDGAPDPAPSPLPAQPATSLVGATASPTVTQAAPPARRWPLALGLGLVLVAGATGAALATGQLSRDTGDAPRRERAKTRKPQKGLDALARLDAAKHASDPVHGSATHWRAVAEDFEAAAKQPRAPARWKAAARYARGQESLLEGRLDAAQDTLKQAHRLDPSWRDPLLTLATVKSQRGDLEGAAKAVSKARRLGPDTWRTVAAAARLEARRNQLEESIQLYRKALELAPGTPQLLAETALVHHAARLDSEARRFAEKALEGNPDLVDARVMLAELALEAGDGAKALKLATRAASVAPREPSPRLAMGDALLLLGRRADAMAAYRKLIALVDKRGLRGAPAARVKAVRAALDAGQLPSKRMTNVERERQALQAPTKAPATPRSRPRPKPPPPQRSRPGPRNNGRREF